MFSSSTNYVNWVDGVFLFILVISIVLLISITITMIYFVVKYNKKKNPYPTQIEGNTKLEIIWTVIPTILVLGMFYYGWLGYKEMQNVPDNAFQIDVTGRMWKWEFKYPNGLKTDSLFVPVNQPIKLNLHSVDVNHTFFIPAFRIKRDVYSNKYNYLWFNAEKPGYFDIACTQYCGLNHAYMYSKVIVYPKEQFNKWYTAATDSINSKSNKIDTLLKK